jgi:hypothetical protein
MRTSRVPCGSSTGFVKRSPIWERRVRAFSFLVKENLLAAVAPSARSAVCNYFMENTEAPMRSSKHGALWKGSRLADREFGYFLWIEGPRAPCAIEIDQCPWQGAKNRLVGQVNTAACAPIVAVGMVKKPIAAITSPWLPGMLPNFSPAQ